MLNRLIHKELLKVAERLVKQTKIIQQLTAHRIARTHELEVRIKALRLLMITARDNQRPGADAKDLSALIDDAFARTGGEDVVFPELGFADQVTGVERNIRGIRRREPDDSWTPPFDQLTQEQAAAYIDAELELDAVARVFWWTVCLDDFDHAMPLQVLNEGRYRELWEWASRMRLEHRWGDLYADADDDTFYSGGNIV